MTASGMPLAGDEAFEDLEREGRATLIVDLEGFEGPLDLLLKLARDQKIDLTRLSVLVLAEQYLAFVETARRLSLELAADYLVMAAWLAWLKSRLLLPADSVADLTDADDPAEDLAFRLRRLDSIRSAGRALMARPQLGSDVVARGLPDAGDDARIVVWEAGLHDLLSAYGALRLHRVVAVVRLAQRRVVSLAQARDRLAAALERVSGWQTLDALIDDDLREPELRRTTRASSFSAGLEMARVGELEFSQSAPFAPLYLRARPAAGLPAVEAAPAWAIRA